MSDALVVVGIPAEDEKVWDVSTEKVPHITLLYLARPADDATAKQIVDFITHAADTSLSRFMLDVDRRGTLGEDEADVLFFAKFGMRELKEFRSNCLKDETIRTAYDSTEQFPEWTPHLTIGYPDRPAKLEERRDLPRWISFDRIAVWDGDSEGPTIQLKTYDYEEADLTMGSDLTQEILSHHGVKGMRWGVRRKNIGGPGEVTVSTNASRMAKTKIRTKGGEAHPAHPDAIAARVTGRTLKKSGTNALSNKELQDLATRLNLERQVKSLAPQGPGKKLVAGILRNTAKKQVQRVADDVAAKQVEQLLNKQR